MVVIIHFWHLLNILNLSFKLHNVLVYISQWLILHIQCCSIGYLVLIPIFVSRLVSYFVVRILLNWVLRLETFIPITILWHHRLIQLILPTIVPLVKFILDHCLQLAICCIANCTWIVNTVVFQTVLILPMNIKVKIMYLVDEKIK